MKALSIRQPWAWLIAHGFKPFENRTWQSDFKGQIKIHAGKTMTRADYDACVIFCNGLKVKIPNFPTFDQLKAELGGIVGQAEIVKCVAFSEDEWFTGPYAFKLKDAKVLPFQPCNGQLGFFDVKEAA